MRDLTQRDARYETAGVCPACGEVVTARQESWTFPNVIIPLGPPVTFHQRRRCSGQAIAYEARVAGFEKHPARLSCPGFLTRHSGQPDMCGEAECPGLHVPHRRGFDATCLRRPCAECAGRESTPAADDLADPGSLP